MVVWADPESYRFHNGNSKGDQKKEEIAKDEAISGV